ncbi:MAG: AraC family transcriptional regulator [Lentisphaeria bacterium]
MEVQIFTAKSFFRLNMPGFALLHTQNAPDLYPEHNNIFHKREFWQVFYIETGQGILLQNGSRYSFQAGFCGVRHPDDLTTYRLKQPITLYNILFKRSFLENFISFMSKKNPFFSLFEKSPQNMPEHDLIHLLDANRVIISLIHKMEAEYYCSNPDSEEMLRVQLMELLLRMSRLSSSSTPQRLHRRMIPLTMKYLQQHFREKIQIGGIAEKFGFSRSYFLSLFKRKTGKTIGQTLLYFRLLHAKNLLFSSNLPIEQVCYDSGFSEIANFYKVFRRETGMPPGQFRQLRQNSKER